MYAKVLNLNLVKNGYSVVGGGHKEDMKRLWIRLKT